MAHLLKKEVIRVFVEYLELNFSNLIVKAVSQNLRTQKKMNVMNELWVTVSISLFLF